MAASAKQKVMFGAQVHQLLVASFVPRFVMYSLGVSRFVHFFTFLTHF